MSRDVDSCLSNHVRPRMCDACVAAWPTPAARAQAVAHGLVPAAAGNSRIASRHAVDVSIVMTDRGMGGRRGAASVRPLGSAPVSRAQPRPKVFRPDSAQLPLYASVDGPSGQRGVRERPLLRVAVLFARSIRAPKANALFTRSKTRPRRFCPICASVLARL